MSTTVSGGVSGKLFRDMLLSLDTVLCIHCLLPCLHVRCKYQGVYPPVPRSEEDFDPAELRHITTSTPYLRLVFVIEVIHILTGWNLPVRGFKSTCVHQKYLLPIIPPY